MHPLPPPLAIAKLATPFRQAGRALYRGAAHLGEIEPSSGSRSKIIRSGVHYAGARPQPWNLTFIWTQVSSPTSSLTTDNPSTPPFSRIAT